jgi:hypothetical protein
MNSKMFLAQKWMNRGIMAVIVIDLLAGYAIKAFANPEDLRLIGILYLFNIAALIGVYRFWKMPLFEWDDVGFILYGITPFKKTYGSWERIEKAGFKTVTDNDGKASEFLVVIFLDTERKQTVGAVPMKYVAFDDKLKDEFKTFAKKKKIPQL